MNRTVYLRGSDCRGASLIKAMLNSRYGFKLFGISSGVLLFVIVWVVGLSTAVRIHKQELVFLYSFIKANFISVSDVDVDFILYDNWT